MAITGPIPIGQMPGDIFNQGSGVVTELLQRARQLAMEKQYKQAQINQLESETNYNNFLRYGDPQASMNASNTGMPGNTSMNGGPIQDYSELMAKMQSMKGGNAPMPMQNQSPMNQYAALQAMFQNQGNPQQQFFPQMPQNGYGMQETVIRPGNPQFAHLNARAGQKGVPQNHVQPDQNGNLIITKPNGEVSMVKMGPNASELARSTEFAKEDVKTASNFTNEIAASADKLRTATQLNKVLNSDTLKKLYDKLPPVQQGRKVTLDYLYRNLGNTEEKKAIANMENLSNEIIAQGSRVFAGPFRVGEQALLTKMKVSPDDALDVSIQKGKNLEEASRFIYDINRRVPGLIRKGLPAEEALETAIQESGVEAFMNKVAKQDYMKEASENKTQSKYQDTDMVIVEGPNGEEIMTYAKAKSLGAI